MELYSGLDLSLTGTGIVLIDDDNKVEQEFLIKSKKEGDSPVAELYRIKKIVRDIKEVVGKAVGLRFAAIEGIAYGVRKTTHLAQLSALNYFVRDVLYEMDVPFVVVAPKTVKKYITESGNASKEDMMLQIFERYGISFHNDNLADAFGLATIARDMYLREEGLTKSQISAINNLAKQLK